MGSSSACDMNCDACKDDASALITKGIAGKTWEYFHYSTPRSVIGAGLTQPITIDTFADSYFVVKKLLAVATVNPLVAAANSFSALFYNGATGRTLMNLPINARNLFGAGNPLGIGEILPANLKDAIILPPSSTLQIAVTDLSGAPNTVQLVFGGYRWYDLSKPPVVKRGNARLEWYSQSVNTVLAANAQSNVQIRIDSDADFLVRKIMAVTTNPYTVQISDSSTQESWSDVPQVMSNLAGNAAFPYWLPKPKLIRANSTISFQFADLGAGTTIQFVLEGAKVYR